MSKKKTSQIHKKKIHPLIKMLMGLFMLSLVGVAVTAFAYKDVSPLQEVAGASTTPTPFPTPSAACIIVNAVIGIGPCGKDSYRGVAFTCGDGTSFKPTVTPTLAPPPTGIKATNEHPFITTIGECRSLTAWMTKVAQVCAGHSTCKPTVTPTRFPTPSGKPHPSIFPLRTSNSGEHTSQGSNENH